MTKLIIVGVILLVVLGIFYAVNWSKTQDSFKQGYQDGAKQK